MMTSAQVVETSVTATDNSLSQDYTHPDDQTTPSQRKNNGNSLVNRYTRTEPKTAYALASECCFHCEKNYPVCKLSRGSTEARVGCTNNKRHWKKLACTSTTQSSYILIMLWYFPWWPSHEATDNRGTKHKCTLIWVAICFVGSVLPDLHST